MLLLQASTILFAFALAYLNKWPVYKFRETGANKRMENQFHEANAVVKIFYAIDTLYMYEGKTSGYFILVASQLLILWLFFDICLNFFTDKPLFYVGNTAKLDKLQRKHLGKYAGQIKAGVCIVVIGLLNWLYYSL